MKSPFISGKEYMQFQESYNNMIKNEQLQEQKKRNLEQEAYNETVQAILKNEANRSATTKKYSEFVIGVKESFLGECMYELFSKCINESHDLKKEEPIMRSLIAKYIKENGVTNIMHSWKTKSYLLSEMSIIVEKACEKALENCDKDKPDSFVISTQIRDEFFDNLKAADMENITDTIAMRVSSAASEFVTANRLDKIAIEDILRDAKDKIDHAKEADKAKVEESANIAAKRQIAKIRTSGSKNLYHHLVESMLKSTLKDEKLKEHFSENGEINMDKIVSYADTMYTFLEMLNTTKIEPMTTEKVEELLASM